jgi:hypothetical protein
MRQPSTEVESSRAIRGTHWTVGYRFERADGDHWVEVTTWLPRRAPGRGGMMTPNT